jgi:peptidoglycan hydrolase-like protein with peptidoglycan-binding domain
MDRNAQHAQQYLTVLGYLDQDPQSGVLDDSTRFAIKRYQELHKLPLTSEADDNTLAAMKASIEANEYVLLGLVEDPAGPIPGVAIDIRDRDLGSTDSWPSILPGAAISTDEDGRFQVLYTLNQVAPGDWKKDDKDYVPDLVFQLSQQPVAYEDFDIIRLPSTEPVSKDEQRLGIQAHRLEEVRIVLNTASRRRWQGDSEYEQLLADFTRTFDQRPPDSLEESQQEVSFVARELARPFDLVDALRLAFKISKSAFAQDVGADIIYALIRTRGVNSVYDLATSTKDDLIAALKQAISELIIAQIDDERIVRIVELILQLAPSKALEADGVNGSAARLQQVLQHVLPDTEAQTELIRRLGLSDGDTVAFWKSLAQAPAFAAEGKVQSIQFALQLDRLTGSNLQLMAVLQQDGQGVKSTRQLLQLGEQGLLDLINQHDIAAPEGTAGSNLLEQRKSYAADIIGALHLALPTESVAKILNDAPHLIDTDEVVSGAVRQFLSLATGDEQRAADTAYDIRTTRLSQYLEKHGAATFVGVDPKVQKKAIPHLQRAQRLFKLSTGPESFKALFASGLDSAHAIAQVPRQTFIAQWGEQVGKLDAMMIHSRAQSTSASALQVYVALRDALSGGHPQALDLVNAETKTSSPQTINAEIRKAAEPLLKAIPYWESLFGPQELCDCKHCRSVLSPAAYLVDLLHFLEGPALDVLIGSKTMLGRRPDIAQLKLSCENTNTSLPYVDLVNEVLESLAQAYANASLAVESPIFDNQTVPARDTGDATTAELQANPQYSIAAAYAPGSPTVHKAIDTALFPLSLPFSQPLATARVYLNHLGVPLAELIEALNPVALTDTTWTAEALQLAPAEIPVLTGSTTVDELYGLSPELLPILRKGDRGLWVAALKRLMNVEGAGLTLAVQAANEEFDDSCLAAVKAYQTAHGMLVTGEVKHLAWETLLTLTPPLRSLVLPAPRELISRLGIDYEELTELLQLSSINPAISALKAVTKTLALPKDDLLAFIAVGFTAPSVALLQALAAGGGAEAEFTKWAGKHFAGANLDAFLSTALLEVDKTDPCNLDHVRLRRWEEAKPDLDDSFWLRLANFVRLSRRLGWTFAELDTVLRSLPAIKLTAGVLEQLAQINKLKARLQLSLPELVELWAAPDALTTGSPYANRFLSRAALRNDPAFAPDWKGQVLAEADRPEAVTVTITTHTPALLAGFRLSSNELADILSDAGLTDDMLITHDVLGQITRRVTLARALSLRAIELGTLATLIRQGPAGADLFQAPARNWTLLQFVETLDLLSGVNLSVTDLGGIYLNHGLSDKVMAEQFATVLLQLEEGFAQIAPDVANAKPETGPVFDPLLTDLSFVTDDITTAQAILAAIDGTARQSVPLDGAPIIPAPIDKRLSVQPVDNQMGITQATLNLRGRLTDAEIITLKALPTLAGLHYFIDELARAADAPIHALLGRLQALGQLSTPAKADALDKLLTTPSLDSEGKPDPTAAKRKRAYLTALLGPIVTLVRHRVVVKNVLSTALKLPPDVTALLLEPIHGSTTALLRSVRDALAPMIDDFTAVASAAVAAKAQLKPADLPEAVAAFTRLHKASAIINAISLSKDELSAIHGRWVDFNTLPIVATTDTAPFADLLRLAAFVKLKADWHSSKIAQTAVLTASDLVSAAEMLGLGTDRPAVDILALTDALDWSLADLQDPQKLLRLIHSLELIKRLGVSAETAIIWAKGPVTPDLADQIKRTAKSKYNDEAWLIVAAPLADAIRESSRAALVAYLVPRLHLQDSNQLYQTLLIDVETAPGALTSRVKQAISSIQLFIQRCLLNLEPNVPPTLIDRKQWEWMQRYRVWEANRKVFLNPHVYIRPELLDNKTPFFKELESELLQGELTNEACERAIGHYLEKLHTVAKLEIGGMCIQNDFQPDELNKEVVHLFGRTANVPNKWFYRRYEVSRNDVSTWTPWEEVPLDIQGDRVAPAVWNRRLYLFWPMITRKAAANESAYDEFQLAWSELIDCKWTSKKVSPQERPVGIFYGLGVPRQLYVSDVLWRHEQLVPERSKKLVSSARAAAQLTREWLGGGAISPPPVGDDGRKEVNQTPQPSSYFPDELPSFSSILPGMPTPLRGAYGYAYAGDSILLGQFDGQAFTHDADFALRSCHATVELSALGSRRFVSGYALRPAKNGLTVQHLSEQPTQPVQILSSGVGRLTEPFYVHQAHSYFCTQGGAQSLLGIMNQGAGALLRSLDKPVKLKAIIATNAKIAPSEPGTDNENPPVSLDAGQIGIDQSNMANAWLSATANLSMATKEVASKTSAIQSTALNEYLELDDAPHIVFETLAHPLACKFSEALARYGLPGLLSTETQNPTLLAFAKQPFNTQVVHEPYPNEGVDFGQDLSSHALRSTAFSSYNWELFFHIPMLLADRLLQSNHFEEALRMVHYVFDPTDGKGGYWKFKPFASVGSSARLDNVKSLLASIQKASSDGLKQLAEWHDHPFQPHLLARHRIGEYMKFVARKLLDICIKAGDYHFGQDTIESIEIARLFYVMAADVSGPRTLKVPAPGRTTAKSFAELRGAGLDEFGNALVAFENELPFYNSASTSAIEEGSTVLGISRSGYFGIPQDETLLAQWDLIEDRLFKIRHSMNIDGVTRQLPLFEPPIDPMLLVQAAARGIDINSVINDLSTPMPAYRFSYMLQRALEMCNEVKSFGSALLSTLEKKDGEALAQLRASQELTMLRLVRDVKLHQQAEARNQLSSASLTIATVTARMKHYQNQIDSGLLDQEREQQAKLGWSIQKAETAGDVEVAAGIAHAVPNLNIDAKLQVLSSWSIGGSNVGSALNAIARWHANVGIKSGSEANLSAIDGQNARRQIDWQFQVDTAKSELLQLAMVEAAAKSRLDAATTEIRNHDKQIEHATEIDDFLRRQKYTNQELYAWMESKISEVYYQSYQLAYELAKKAERAYRFELGLTNSDFIKFGSWDSQRKGLMAGEQLALQLRQMERAYHEANKREYEITKHVSLLSLDPMALIRLKEVGTTKFALPEALFDMDFAGHYMRRIKSVSITLPCVTGPYASVSATLRLMKSRIRYKPETAVGYAPREDDTRFLTNYAATRAVATSTGQNDAGMFELNFRDERYLPFEGEGVESLWQLEINKDYAGFDIHTLSDAVLHIRYTAREGGETLKQAAKTHLTEALKSTFTTVDGKPQPLTRLFSLRHEFPEAWNELTQQVSADETGEVIRVLTLPITKDRFPFFTLGRKVMPTRVAVLIEPKLDANVPDFKVTLQNKLLSHPGTSSDPNNSSLVHQIWSAEDSLPQIAHAERSEWKLSLALDAIAMRSAVERLEELVVAVEYTLGV